MAPELSEQERALLGRCPLFLGAEDALLRRLPALPGVTLESFAAGDLLYGPSQFRRSLGVLLAGQVQVTNGSLSVSLLRAGGALRRGRPLQRRAGVRRRPHRPLPLPGPVSPSGDPGPPAGGGASPPPQLPPVPHRARPVPVRAAALGGPDRRGGEAGRYLLTLPSGEPLRLSATDLAKRLGISRASLYRAFQALEDARLIRREGKSMYVLDPAGLEGVL